MRTRRAAAIAGMLSTTNAKRVQVIDQPRETLASFTRQENERIAAEQEAQRKRIEAEQRAKLEEIERPLREAVTESSRNLTMFWNKSLSVIRDFGVDLSPIDMIGDYVIDESNVYDSQLDVRAHKEFQNDLASRGCTLSSDGWDRLGGFLEALRFHRQASLTVVANWETALERMMSLDVFQPGEISGYRPQVTEPQPAVRHEPAPALTMNDLMNVDAGTQEGRQEAKRIADDLYSTEAAGLYRQWIDHIREKFGYSVTRKDADRIAEWFTTNNKSWLFFDNFNQVKRYLVSIHHWPESMLTREEKAILDIENLPRQAGESDFSYRRRAQALARG